ncbi:GRAS transcription factor [Trema orientale]|uniref:GRAS transcription factor n=1 Tax=Trema orientale TaxID=63057 RepID=A0A2P5D669_TREOI|nr:GRAS transcription factor [Trema orientale]
MIMDPSFNEYPDFTNGFKIENQTIFPNSNEYNFNRLSPDFEFLDNSLNLYAPPPDPDPGTFIPTPSIDVSSVRESPFPSTTEGTDGGSSTPPSSVSPGGDSSSDENEFSETVFKYINSILMEENMEEKPHMFYDPLDLQVTEKSFYDALGERYPYSPNQSQIDQKVETPDSVFSGSSSEHGGSSTSTSTSTSNSASSPQLVSDLGDHKPSSLQSSLPVDNNFQFDFLMAQNLFRDSDSISLFQRGVEEASKFLPKCNQLVIDLESHKFSPELKREDVTVKVERENSPNGSRGRKNHEREDPDLEERSNKQSAVYVDESELSDMFDRVLLHTDHGCKQRGETESGKSEASKNSQPNKQAAGSNANGGKARGKKQGKKKETVDLRTLLILCAQAVSADDRRTANELLKQIRQHSSPLGDGSQRLAHCFANGLEARLAGTGTGTQLYYSTLLSNVKASEILKAYQLHLSSCPFKKMAIVFANKMIMKVAEKATSLHIVDFGILYGFQWPILIQHLSKRAGGPPKLRITGIEFPQKGFRPAERIEETGRRLEKYCERFGVPFKYNAIASQNWETIRVEDIKIDSNEVVAVNCLMRFKHLLDETVEVNCPRNVVLNLIRKMNPAIFVQSIANGSYNAPFFVTRFREALFHFSALFDVLDTNISRENEERLMFEKEFYGREAMNVIACEGLERVERPETYKQWQVRNLRAGFQSLPLNQELMSAFREKLKKWYHKDFVIDEDSNWILQGWKGRIVYASACWVPA